MILGEFDATTGTDRDDHESCIGPHGPRSKDESSSMLLDFANRLGLRMVPEARLAPLDSR